MSSSQSHSRSVISATSRAQGDSLLDPIYISDAEDEATPEVTYISSDSEDEDGHFLQDAIANEVVHDEVLGENMMQCHSCPICLEIAFQPYMYVNDPYFIHFEDLHMYNLPESRVDILSVCIASTS
ncbi:hypothetical protein GG344DRAFT_79368 [Lentinula edodes]|nr:hypothetical protein GG344DRAFT_79368 [Lentinula edodes]